MSKSVQPNRVREFLAGIGEMSFGEFSRAIPTRAKVAAKHIETQEHTADYLYDLLEANVEHRIVWAELTGYVDFRKWLNPNADKIRCACLAPCGKDKLNPNHWYCQTEKTARIDWLILSGSPTAPTDLAGLRRVIADCRDASVPVWVRNIGVKPRDPVKGPEFGLPIGCASKVFAWGITTKSPTGSDPSEWPEDLRVQQTPEWLKGE